MPSGAGFISLRTSFFLSGSLSAGDTGISEGCGGVLFSPEAAEMPSSEELSSCEGKADSADVAESESRSLNRSLRSIWAGDSDFGAGSFRVFAPFLYIVPCPVSSHSIFSSGYFLIMLMRKSHPGLLRPAMMCDTLALATPIFSAN